MTTKKGLQKFTKTETKINKILSLKQINPSDVEHLNKSENAYFNKIVTEKLNTLKDSERDKFIKQIEPITVESTKNQLWEYNHNQIIYAISTIAQECGRMPTNTEIAIKTELSRQTVHKHMKEFSSHPLYVEQMEQFKLMSSKVLARVFKFAINGDIGAAKLYFNVMGYLNNKQTQNNTLIQNQNNYIQINGTILSQETIKQLSPEQLNTIESVLKAALPEIELTKPQEKNK